MSLEAEIQGIRGLENREQIAVAELERINEILSLHIDKDLSELRVVQRDGRLLRPPMIRKR